MTCSDAPTSPKAGSTIELSAAQAAAIRSRVAQLAPVHPELAWLADSLGLVVGAGLQARRVDVTPNIYDRPFYAVALQRTMKASSLSWATFDIVMFSNPSEPADSIVARGLDKFDEWP